MAPLLQAGTKASSSSVLTAPFLNILSALLSALAVAGALCAQPAPDPTEVLAHARDNLIERRERLPNYTCVQTVDRSYWQPALPAQRVPSCDQMPEGAQNSAGRQLYLTDRLHLDVKVSQGNEIGSWAGASQFDSRSIFELVGRGPFGTGALGPFLSDIFAEGSASFEFGGEKPESGAKLYEYSFRVPLGSSHYSVQVGRDWRPLAYEGLVRIDSQSFDLRYLLVRVTRFPSESETCKAVTMVDYGRIPMGAGTVLLPQRSRLNILMSDGNESNIATKYTSCREYRGEATIHFGDGPPALTSGASKGPTDLERLPVGLTISLALAAPIDTETAAAGDIVVEKVQKPVRLGGKVLIPEGTLVHGRIIRMRHWLASSPRFEIAIRLETWETGGLSLPIYAKPAPRRKSPIVLPPAGEPAGAGAFIFETSEERYIAQGFQSNWTTVAAPRKP